MSYISALSKNKYITPIVYIIVLSLIPTLHISYPLLHDIFIFSYTRYVTLIISLIYFVKPITLLQYVYIICIVYIFFELLDLIHNNISDSITEDNSYIQELY